MPNDFGPMLTGGLAGAVVSLIVNSLIGVWRRWRLRQKMLFQPGSRVGHRGTARVYNGHVFPLNSVYAYITIEHDLEDVLDPPDPVFAAFISKGHLGKVEEDRLCWSSTAPFSNPPVIDIYAHEKQALDIVNIEDGKWIEIPSEKGWTTSQDKEVLKQKRAERNDDLKTSRVFLKPKKYRAKIKIVSKDTKAKEFSIEIDPADPKTPVKLL
jgi:hypothetical protein